MSRKEPTLVIVAKETIAKFNEQERLLGIRIKHHYFWIGKTEKQLDMYEQTLASAMSNLPKKA